MMALADVFHDNIEIASINGKSYPYTERLEYTQGEDVRWRVINTGFGEHPMHLHGAFFQVLSLGNFESDTAFPEGERQRAVTQNIMPYHTAMLEWTPTHPGRWLYHCHFQAHISAGNRVPTFAEPAMHSLPTGPAEHVSHDSMDMPDMAGLVMAISVKPAANSAQLQRVAAQQPHKLDLVIEPNAASGNEPTFSCSVREGKKVLVTKDGSMGPTIVVTRGQPTEITVLNHLKEPTIIHWHGLELDSYYDGVMGGGDGRQVTPLIEPGASFTARFTPNRVGTFIYHTHAPKADQLSGGIYGALIVLDPGETYDAERDKVMVIGTHDADFFATKLTLNGSEKPGPMLLKRGTSYRLRLINIAPELRADVLLGSKEHPATWLAIAKDGATLPPRLNKSGDAKLHIVSGETYDFSLQPETAGEIPLLIKNELGDGKVETMLVVQ
jgi:manganese oxidase